MTIAAVNFESYNSSITEALDLIGAKEELSRQSAFLIKPNLINSSLHPVTPPVNRIIAGFDPFEVDRKGAELLGMDWRQIRHLVDW